MNTLSPVFPFSNIPCLPIKLFLATRDGPYMSPEFAMFEHELLDRFLPIHSVHCVIKFKPA